MIIRQAEKEDIQEISRLVSINPRLLELALENALTSMIVKEDKIEGFVIVRKLADINEITHWHLNKEHSLVLKSLIKSMKGPLVSIEKVSSKEKIKMLEEYGFKKINEIEGVYPSEKALVLRRD